VVKGSSEGWIISNPSVVRPTLLYANFEVVIPAPYRVQGKLQREFSSEILDSGSSPEGQSK
jgi:hypothetical protein